MHRNTWCDHRDPWIRSTCSYANLNSDWLGFNRGGVGLAVHIRRERSTGSGFLIKLQISNLKFRSLSWSLLLLDVNTTAGWFLRSSIYPQLQWNKTEIKNKIKATVKLCCLRHKPFSLRPLTWCSVWVLSPAVGQFLGWGQNLQSGFTLKIHSAGQ